MNKGLKMAEINVTKWANSCVCVGGGRPHALCHGGEQRGLRKVPSMTKSDIIVTNIAISVNKSALLVNRSALSVNIKKCPFSLLLSAFLKTDPLPFGL